MSEPLSKVLGFKKDEVYGGTFADNQIQIGKNMVLDELDQRSPDVEKLARIIYEQQYNRNININSRCPDWKKEAPYVKERFFLLAQAIINQINVWIVKKGA